MQNYWGIKPVRPFRFDLDTDRDRVPDWKDCKPFNSKMQHMKSRRKKEIDELPVYVTSEATNLSPSERANLTFHIASRDAREKAPRATARTYSFLNRHPDLIKKIKDTNEEWEKREGRPAFFGRKAPKGYGYVFVDSEIVGQRTGSSTGGSVYLFGLTKDDQNELEKNLGYPVKIQDVDAEILYHEFTHENQYLRDPEFDSKYDKFMDKHVYRESGHHKPSHKVLHKRYYSCPYEAEASDVAKEKMDKVLKKVSDDDIYTGFRNIIDEYGGY